MTTLEIKKRILPILKCYGVVRASLFGSRIRGEMNDKSDIDLLVELPENSSLLDLGGLKSDLEEALRIRVDLLTYDSLHPLLRERILSEQEAVL
jgi:hypothetical protein